MMCRQNNDITEGSLDGPAACESYNATGEAPDPTIQTSYVFGSRITSWETPCLHFTG
jgi:hypothetical protein